MKALLLAIAKQMVDLPEQVSVTEISGPSTVVLELSVAMEDLGKIIGQKGRNITAIRTLVNAAGAKYRKRVIVELIE